MTIATEGGLPPWNSINAAGELEGFEIDLGRELCRRTGFDCRFVAQDWDGLIPALLQGKYDAVMAGMMITDKRLQAIDFAGPYATSPSQFGIPKESPLTAQPFDVERADLTSETPSVRAALATLQTVLRGKTVGVQTNTVQGAFMERYFPETKTRFYPKIAEVGLDLNAGRIDAAFLDHSSLDALIQDGNGRIVPVGPSFARGVLGRGVGMGLRKGDGVLKAAFDRAILDAAADGTIDALASRFFSYKVGIPRQP